LKIPEEAQEYFQTNNRGISTGIGSTDLSSNDYREDVGPVLKWSSGYHYFNELPSRRLTG
jgi:hypothetical protein